MPDPAQQYAALRQAVERALEAALPPPPSPWRQGAVAGPLNEAMRYSLLSGGKRLRPVMLLAAYGLVQEDWRPALPFAAALEMVHTYSLIHDDLPAMDNDDLRRGRPTAHKAFGEALAILSGDALLNEAFETCASVHHPRALDFIRLMSNCAGARGMIAGQTADMLADRVLSPESLIRYLQYNKTAQLFIAAVVGGLTLAGASEAQIALGRQFAQSYGAAFQMVDDWLDVHGDEAAMGKRTHKDADKLTWPSVFGEERTLSDVKDQLSAARQAAKALGEKAAVLDYLAQQLMRMMKN